MTAQAVPSPNFRLPFVERDGTLAAWAQVLLQALYARTGGAVDKVDAAHVLGAAAVPKGTEVVAGGGLQAGGALGGNVGLTLYVTVSLTANLPTTGVAEGDWAYAADGRKPGEASGSGTGVPVFYSQAAWYSACGGAVATS